MSLQNEGSCTCGRDEKQDNTHRTLSTYVHRGMESFLPSCFHAVLMSQWTCIAFIIKVKPPTHAKQSKAKQSTMQKGTTKVLPKARHHLKQPIKAVPVGTSLAVQWLRLRLPMQGVQVPHLGSWDPTCRDQKTKTQNRSNILTNSIKT